MITPSYPIAIPSLVWNKVGCWKNHILPVWNTPVMWSQICGVIPAKSGFLGDVKYEWEKKWITQNFQGFKLLFDGKTKKTTASSNSMKSHWTILNLHVLSDLSHPYRPTSDTDHDVIHCLRSPWPCWPCCAPGTSDWASKHLAVGMVGLSPVESSMYVDLTT